jgi:hypothetical protein
MKVKTFTGTDTKRIDKQINDWLEKSGAKVLKTNTAIKQFTMKGEDQVIRKPVTRILAVTAISVWYDEPPQHPSGRQRN